jgi:hypothetical protein
MMIGQMTSLYKNNEKGRFLLVHGEGECLLNLWKLLLGKIGMMEQKKG